MIDLGFSANAARKKASSNISPQASTRSNTVCLARKTFAFAHILDLFVRKWPHVHRELHNSTDFFIVAIFLISDNEIGFDPSNVNYDR